MVEFRVIAIILIVLLAVVGIVLVVGNTTAPELDEQHCYEHNGTSESLDRWCTCSITIPTEPIIPNHSYAECHVKSR